MTKLAEQENTLPRQDGWDVLVRYWDNETIAEISVTFSPTRYRLRWFDRLINEWHEDFPTFDLARRRLGALIVALTTESKLFDRDYDAFMTAELSGVELYEWKYRDYINALARRGYKPRVNNIGHTFAVETASIDGRVITWAETAEGWARIGFYPAHLMASGHEGAMIDRRDVDALTEELGWTVADLLDAVQDVVVESISPHTHDFGGGFTTPTRYCRICGQKDIATEVDD